MKSLGRSIYCYTALVTLVLSSSPGIAAELGMQAPPLAISTWLKGSPVQLGAKGNTNVYVVEFWATWCGPCRITIPHLTSMQAKYKDRGVVFVGITSEEAQVAKPFVRQMGDQMGYVVAVDDNQKTTERYMAAFEAAGIPHAFIVSRDGKIIWQGHPMEGLEETIEQVLTGKYSVRRAQLHGQFVKDAQQYLTLVATVGASPESTRLGKKILADGQNEPGLLRRFASIILTDGRIRHRDIKLALEAARVASRQLEDKEPAMLQTYAQALFDDGQHSEAIRVQKGAIALAKNSEDRQVLEKDLAEFEKRLAASK